MKFEWCEAHRVFATDPCSACLRERVERAEALAKELLAIADAATAFVRAVDAQVPMRLTPETVAAYARDLRDAVAARRKGEP